VSHVSCVDLLLDLNISIGDGKEEDLYFLWLCCQSE
jgi:hypothetical protein